MNNLKIFFLLGGLSVFFLLIGDLIAGHAGFFVALIIVFFMDFFAYFYASKSILHLYNARKIDENEPSPLLSTVKSLAEKTKMPVPMVYLIDSDAATLFATGCHSNRGCLAVTRGLMTTLNPDELTAVLAQQMIHIQRGDAFLGSVVSRIASALTSFADTQMWTSFFETSVEDRQSKLNSTVMKIVAPIASLLIRSTIPPVAEFESDEAGATLCGHPERLSSALQKLEIEKKKNVFLIAEVHPATAHLFIINPLSDENLSAQFETHPSTEERIRRLNLITGFEK